MAASRAMLNGDWKKCRDYIVNDKMNAKVIVAVNKREAGKRCQGSCYGRFSHIGRGLYNCLIGSFLLSLIESFLLGLIESFLLLENISYGSLRYFSGVVEIFFDL